MSDYMSGQSTEYDPACDKCGCDPALCKCYETENERMSDKLGVCKDGGKCGIGGYCDDCHSVPAETEFEGYPGIANDFESAKQRIAELEKQLAERDAALARCVEALEKLARLGNEPHYGNSDGNCIAKAALASLPTSAQATAKVLAAARHLASAWDAYNTSDFNDIGEQNESIAKAESRLREAIREEQETK